MIFEIADLELHCHWLRVSLGTRCRESDLAERAMGGVGEKNWQRILTKDVDDDLADRVSLSIQNERRQGVSERLFIHILATAALESSRPTQGGRRHDREVVFPPNAPQTEDGRAEDVFEDLNLC